MYAPQMVIGHDLSDLSREVCDKLDQLIDDGFFSAQRRFDLAEMLQSFRLSPEEEKTVRAKFMLTQETGEMGLGLEMLLVRAYAQGWEVFVETPKVTTRKLGYSPPKPFLPVLVFRVKAPQPLMIDAG